MGIRLSEHAGEMFSVCPDDKKAKGNTGGSVSGEAQMGKEPRREVLGGELRQEHVYALGIATRTAYVTVGDIYSAEGEPSAFGDGVEVIEQQAALYNSICELRGIHANDSLLAGTTTEPATVLESGQLVAVVVGTPAEQEPALESEKQVVAGISRRQKNNADRRNVLKERKSGVAGTGCVLEQHKAMEGGVDNAVKLHDSSVVMVGQNGHRFGERYTLAEGRDMEQDQAGMSVSRSSFPRPTKYRQHHYSSLAKKRNWEASSWCVEGELLDV